MTRARSESPPAMLTMLVGIEAADELTRLLDVLIDSLHWLFRWWSTAWSMTLVFLVRWLLISGMTAAAVRLARTARIAMTTSNSGRVKPGRRDSCVCVLMTGFSSRAT